MSKAKKQGNLFDKILKENAPDIFFPLIERNLGTKIIHFEPMVEKIQTTLEREADSLNIIKTADGRKMILHIEFQTKADKEMVYRMAEYHGLELRKYQLEIKHFVIYLGKGNPKMITELPDTMVYKGFELLNLRKYNPSQFLNAQQPREIIYAILTNYRTNQAEKIVKDIFDRLKKLCENENELRKYIAQLNVLAKLRNLDKVTKKIIQTMPITYDITKDSFYTEGLEKGIEKGIALGKEKGIELGKAEERRKNDLKNIEAIRNLIELGFDSAKIKSILSLSDEEYQRLIKLG